MNSWTDCLVMLQQGQVDAISTDDVVLAGLAAQDPTVEVVGASLGVEPYGIGIMKENSDLVRFVNGVLEEVRLDGTWERLYNARSAQPRAGARPADAAVSGLIVTVLTTDEIDRELDSRAKEVAAMSSTLVELDNHSGLAHVRRYPPTGLTAQRWAVIEKSLAQLWEDLGHMTSILESARTVRAGGSRLDDDERAELTTLLRGRPLEVSRQRVPLAQRVITSPSEVVEYVGLADTAGRMSALYPGVVEFLDSVDEIDSLIAEGLAPSQELLDEAGATGPQEIAELLLVSATDPLSLTKDDIEERINAITDVCAPTIG